MSYGPTGYPQPHYDQDYADSQSSNALGIAGLVLSLLGLLFTCGLISPLGLIVSLIALAWPPRGAAIAGAIIGAIGTLLLMLFGMAMIVGILGIGAAATAAVPVLHTQSSIQNAQLVIEQYQSDHGQLPDDADGQSQIAGVQDGYGKALRYTKLSDTEYEIRSAGPDRRFDTADDVTDDSIGRLPTPVGEMTVDGSPAMLVAPDGDSLLLAVDESAFDRLNLLQIQDDQQAIAQMISEQQLFRVTSGTPCRIVNTGDLFCEVEISAGEQVGKRGVVGTEFVQ